MEKTKKERITLDLPAHILRAASEQAEDDARMTGYNVSRKSYLEKVIKDHFSENMKNV